MRRRSATVPRQPDERRRLSFRPREGKPFRVGPVQDAGQTGRKAVCNQRRCRADEGRPLQVLVRDNNVEQALKVLKKKMQREGVFREMKARRSYEKPSQRRAREKAEAVRRSRKAARKLAQREGLLPGPKKKPRSDRAESSICFTTRAAPSIRSMWRNKPPILISSPAGD